MSVAARLSAIEARIAAACVRAGREPSSVRLVGASKHQPLDTLLEAHRAGLRLFGENYAQELLEKQVAMPEDVEWHFIGHLQSKKARAVAQVAARIHAVDSEKLGRTLGEAARAAGRVLPVLLQINLGQEASKSGVDPAAALMLGRALDAVPGLRLDGLMSIPPPGPEARAWFQKLRGLRDRLAEDLGRSLPELSIGMSEDFEIAIEEGATLVRIGTSLFGTRHSAM